MLAELGGEREKRKRMTGRKLTQSIFFKTIQLNENQGY
jgi:hypothetical protein